MENNYQAYVFLKKYVINFVEKNFASLSEKYGITKNDLSDLIKDKNKILEWVLGEFLDYNEFKQKGIIIFSGWENEVHNTVYKIGNKYIRARFKNGEYMETHIYDFVKPKKNKIINITYETVY